MGCFVCHLVICGLSYCWAAVQPARTGRLRSVPQSCSHQFYYTSPDNSNIGLPSEAVAADYAKCMSALLTCRRLASHLVAAAVRTLLVFLPHASRPGKNALHAGCVILADPIRHSLVQIMAALTKDVAEAHTRHVKIQTNGPQRVLQLYCEWANASWVEPLHKMIGQLCRPSVLHDCGFVLKAAAAADEAFAQAQG